MSGYVATRFLSLAGDERVEAEYYVRRSDRRIFTGAMLWAMLGAAAVGAIGYAAIAGAAKDKARTMRDLLDEQVDRLRNSADYDRRNVEYDIEDRMRFSESEEERAELRRERLGRLRGIQERFDADLEELRAEFAGRADAPPGLAWGIVVLPALVFLYFLLRHRPDAKGYVVLTNRRVIYYEYDEHPRQNYRYVSEARLSEVTSVHLGAGRSLLRRYMYLTVTTKRYAPIYVAAVGGAGLAADLVRADASPFSCVPADDAIACVQELGGRIRTLQQTESSQAPTASGWTAPAPAPPPPSKPPPPPAWPPPAPPVSSAAPSSAVTCGACGLEATVSTVDRTPSTCPHCGSAL